MLENIVENITEGVIWLTVTGSMLCGVALLISATVALMLTPALSDFYLFGGAILSLALTLTLNKYL